MSKLNDQDREKAEYLGTEQATYYGWIIQRVLRLSPYTHKPTRLSRKDASLIFISYWSLFHDSIS